MFYLNHKISVQNNLGLSTLESLGNNDILFFSQKSFDEFDSQLKNKIKAQIFYSRNISINLEKINDFIDKLDFTPNKIVSFGAGKCTDIAKYVAHKLNIPLTVIITILSNNVFCTDKVCLEKNNLKITLLAKAPEEVIFDPFIINKTKYDLHLMGLCDLLSIHTALFDWNLSENNSQENKNKLIYDIAQTLLNNTFELIKPQDKIEITKIFELLLFSGYITNIYGSGR